MTGRGSSVDNGQMRPPRTLGSLSRLLGVAALAVTLVVPLGGGLARGATAAPSTVTLSVDATSVERGVRVTATGTVVPDTDQRTVLLQRAVPGGWATVSSTVAPAGGSYSLRVPSSYFGVFTFRVVAEPSDTAEAATSESHPLAVIPSYKPAGRARSHAFFTRPVARWDPCRRIDYRVNARRATKGALKDVRGAVTRIRRATGLRFHYAGKTRHVPTGSSADRFPRGTEMVIAWARPAASNMLGAGSTAAGVGGPAYSSGYEDGAGKAAYRILQGSVVLNARLNSRIPRGFGRGQTRGELLMHEIGHALGLAHTQDSRQIMYPTLQRARARFGAGDLAGLSRVGAQQGCLTRQGATSFARRARAQTG